VPRPYYGWVIVGGAFTVLFTAYGTQYSFGLFFAALLDEFGWSRASLAGAFSLYAFAYCVFGFPAGRLTDRWGPRPVIAAGAVFLATALAGMSQVRSLWQPYVLYGIVASLGMGTAYVPCNSTVVKWFVRRRGLAVGLATTGASLGTFALPPVAQALIGAVGWRQAYLIFAAAILVVLSLVALVMRRDPEALGLHPDGDPEPPPREAAGGAAWPLGRAARTRTFWLLAATFTATWIPVFIPLVHLPRFARDLGFPAATGAWLMSTLGLGAVCGRLIMGALSDRFGRRRVVGTAMALQVVAFSGFATVRELPALYATAFLFGYSYGTISTLFTAIVGDFFGRASAGTLVGVLFAMAGSMGGWGPLVAGALYDATGRYTAAFVLAAALNGAAIVLLALCRPPAGDRAILAAGRQPGSAGARA
jgi:MFS family permease